MFQSNQSPLGKTLPVCWTFYSFAKQLCYGCGTKIGWVILQQFEVQFFFLFFFLQYIKFIQLITYNTKETLVAYKYNINTTYNTLTTNTYQRYLQNSF